VFSLDADTKALCRHADSLLVSRAPGRELSAG
jgi:hypothetical protein